MVVEFLHSFKDVLDIGKEEEVLKNIISQYLYSCYLQQTSIIHPWGQDIAYIDGLVQERCNSIANALELRTSCTNPSIYIFVRVWPTTYFCPCLDVEYLFKDQQLHACLQIKV